MNVRLHFTLRLALCALALAATGACSDRAPADAAKQPPSSSSTLGAGASSEPLPPEQAFPLKVEAQDAKTLLAVFTPAPDHYMYRSKTSFALKDASGVRLQAVTLPLGTVKKDPFFGETEVYKQLVQISLPLARVEGSPAKFTLVATYQGCNEKIGLCYSPIETTFDFKLP